MRKLGFVLAVAVMSLVSTTSFAQEVEAVETAVEATEVAQQEAVEIQIGELPEAVTNAIATNFAEHTPAQAFKMMKDEQEVYLVVLTKEDAKEEILFDAEGNVVTQ